MQAVRREALEQRAMPVEESHIDQRHTAELTAFSRMVRDDEADSCAEIAEEQAAGCDDPEEPYALGCRAVAAAIRARIAARKA